MKTKLTLTIEPELLEKAKIYAKKNNTSLSKIFENQLKELTESIKIKRVNVSKLYSGILSDPKLKEMSYDEIRDMYLKDKYGI